jgi:hypothetical protein
VQHHRLLRRHPPLAALITIRVHCRWLVVLLIIGNLLTATAAAVMHYRRQAICNLENLLDRLDRFDGKVHRKSSLQNICRVTSKLSSIYSMYVLFFFFFIRPLFLHPNSNWQSGPQF